MQWRVETLSRTVDAELAALAVDVRESLAALVARITEHGPVSLGPTDTKSLKHGLWELRVRGRDGIARAIYVTRSGQRLVIVLAFTKKTQKTPPHVLDLARKRAKEVLP